MSETVPATEMAGQAAARDARVVMYTTAWCPDCRRAKRVFAALGVPYREIDIEREPEAAATVMRINGGSQSVPTIVFPDGSTLTEPSSAALEAKLRAR